MSKIITDDDGKEVTLYTAEEIEAAKQAEIDRLTVEHTKALEDKDEHVKKKLAEFETGKTAQELKDIEAQRKIDEATRIATEANEKVNSSEARRVDTLKNIARERFTGNDPELNKKFEESWALVNLEIKDDADIARKAELVANMSGLNSGTDMTYGGGMPAGGYAPNFVKKAGPDEVTKEQHEQFSKELGLDSFIKDVAGPSAEGAK